MINVLKRKIAQRLTIKERIYAHILKRRNRRKRKLTIKDRIYIFVLVAGFINIFSPYIVHADVLGMEVYELFVDVTKEVDDANGLLNSAFKSTTISPFEVLDNIQSKKKSSMAVNIHSAVNTVALAVATLLLMVDFFRKCANFEFASKWENILIFLVKIIVIKQVVQNADVIVGNVYALFDTINQKAVGTSVIEGHKNTVKFLPCGDRVTYKYKDLGGIIARCLVPWWATIQDIFGDEPLGFSFEISKDAVKMFYPDATFPKDTDINTLKEFTVGANSDDFKPMFDKIFMFPYFLAMKAIAYYIFVIVIGRAFELAVYTIFAPLPLCTFASETTHDIAKNFLKKYIACTIQIAVIAAMFVVYVAVNDYFSSHSSELLVDNVRLINVVTLLALGLGIHKSGEWSKQICGA